MYSQWGHHSGTYHAIIIVVSLGKGLTVALCIIPAGSHGRGQENK